MTKLVEQSISVSLLKTIYPPVFTSKNKAAVWEIAKQSDQLGGKQRKLVVIIALDGID